MDYFLYWLIISGCGLLIGIILGYQSFRNEVIFAINVQNKKVSNLIIRLAFVNPRIRNSDSARMKYHRYQRWKYLTFIFGLCMIELVLLPNYSKDHDVTVFIIQELGIALFFSLGVLLPSFLVRRYQPCGNIP